MNKKYFYITTTLPYVNAAPHIGFALEIVQADAIARWKRMNGYEVVFNTGTDEHGLKIYQKAIEEGKDPQAYTDEYAPKFDRLKSALNLTYTNFIRTTDAHHVAAAQEFWKRCEANGDIYKKEYKVKYCVGCELEKTDSELENGKCPVHPNLELELIEEENYFFRFSKYGKKLLEIYDTHPDFVLPPHRLKEIRMFVERGLQDFSISRLKEKMPWGIPVPGDEKQVMYVWFDALVNYISTIGWPSSEDADEGSGMFERFWGNKDAPNAIQVAGKDNLRQQSAMWQAMLCSAGLPPSKQILIHGFITSGGQKMSKSLGNVVDPYEVIEKYGTDAARFWLLRDVPVFEDGDFTWKRFMESYNANLANGLGNLVSRVIKMARTYGVTLEENREEIRGMEPYREAMEQYDFQKAMNVVWERIQISDKYIQETEPFKTIKTDPEKAKRDVKELLESVWEIAALLAPLLPGSSEKIREAVENPAAEIAPLFPRID